MFFTGVFFARSRVEVNISHFALGPSSLQSIWTTCTSPHQHRGRAPRSLHLRNFLRTLTTPEPIKDWSLTTLKDKLIKIGAKVVSHGRYVIFQMAEVAIARQMFREILRLIAEPRAQPPPALA
jgi:hypothetical protein